jgi:DNA-binding LacI/PurR family transcriptional regulator
VKKRVIEIGFSVPDDLSVVGFDNIIPAIGIKSALTTIHVYKERIGGRAAELLEWRRKNPAYLRETTSIGVRLITRSSVRERKE